MRNIHKLAVVTLLFMFILPLTMALCCCMNEASAEPSHHSHGAVHDHDGDHQKHEHSHSHNHNECNHQQILSDFTLNQAVQFFDSNISALKIQTPESLLSVSTHVEADAVFFDTGPPGKFSSVPLYLEISVLRI